MKLRRLDIKDMHYMLEWMHDRDVVKDLMARFETMTLEDCRKFIELSQTDTVNLHLAITDDADQYMGTVSLKNIDKNALYAEFAIAIRKCAMGKGFAKYAMSEMLRKGFEEFGLNTIYWDVSKKNVRAIRFYEKMGAELAEDVPQGLLEKYKLIMDEILWYSVQRSAC